MEKISIKTGKHEETGLETRLAFNNLSVNGAGAVTIQLQEEFLDKKGEVFKAGNFKQLGTVSIPMPGNLAEQKEADPELLELGTKILALVKTYLEKQK